MLIWSPRSRTWKKPTVGLKRGFRSFKHRYFIWNLRKNILMFYLLWKLQCTAKENTAFRSEVNQLKDELEKLRELKNKNSVERENAFSVCQIERNERLLLI
jgi:hypothetical protein